MQQNDYNLASIIFKNALEHPERNAISIPVIHDGKLTRINSYNFKEYSTQVIKITHFLKKNFRPGDKVGLLLNIDLDLYACVIAMFAQNIIPVFMEPGMGRKKLKVAMQSIGLKNFIGKKEFLKYRFFIPSFWNKNFYSLDSGGLFICKAQLPEVVDTASLEVLPVRDKNNTALISFTSGTSGTPKGANRTHDSLFFQHQTLKKYFPNLVKDKDLTCFPMVVLHNLCCGVPSIMPPLNFKNIADFDPIQLCHYLVDMQVTRFTAAPKFHHILCDYMLENRITNTDIRLLGVGGAVVEKELIHKLMSVFPNAKGYIVYGSTEAEPMAKISFDDYLESESLDEGHLVGKAVSEANIKLLDYKKLNPNSLPSDIKELEVKHGEVGELVVSGEHVLASYLHNQKANTEIKLNFGDGVIWHRTQDLAKFDSNDNLWLYGRVDDVLEQDGKAIYPFPIEKKLNHFFKRAAIIQNKHALIYVFIEKSTLLTDNDQKIINNILNGFHFKVIRLSHLPVDSRHQSKLDRNELRKIASKTK